MQSLTPAPSPTLQVPDIALRNANLESDPLVRARSDLYDLQPIRDPKLLEAAGALEDGRDAEAERIAAKFLKKHPRNADALNIMAEIAERARNPRLAEQYLAKCVQCAPDSVAYRYNYGAALMALDKLKPALDEIMSCARLEAVEFFHSC